VASRKEQKEQARLEREQKEREHAASQARTRRLSIIGGVVGLALIAVVVAVVVSTSGTKSTSTTTDAKEVNARFADIPQSGITLGEPGAKATIIEYADLKCPFCADWAKNSLPTVVDELVKTGKAKIVFRSMTFLDQAAPGQDSTNAANYAQATGLQNKLWPFIDLLYLNQKPESEAYMTQDFLEGIAKQITGLDAAKAWENRSNPKATNQIQAAADSANENGVTATPTFLVGSSEDDAEKVSTPDLEDPQPIIDAVNALQ
jgi:protein-disulfide isomerase